MDTLNTLIALYPLAALWSCRALRTGRPCRALNALSTLRAGRSRRALDTLITLRPLRALDLTYVIPGCPVPYPTIPCTLINKQVTRIARIGRV